MKADLYTAKARSAGSRGLAHRTAAGFVVLTGADGDDLIALIDEKQAEPDLIDKVVGKAQRDAPSAFAMLFTAGGELYVIASGVVAVSIASATANLSVSAAQGQVLVHQLAAGISETSANIRLHIGDIPDDALTELDLRAGTVEADWVEVAIGTATIAAATEVDEASIRKTTETAAPDAAAQPSAVTQAEEGAAVTSAAPDEPAPSTAQTPAAGQTAEPMPVVPEPPTPPAPAPAAPEPPTPPAPAATAPEPPLPPTPPAATAPEPPTPPAPAATAPEPPTPPAPAASTTPPEPDATEAAAEATTGSTPGSVSPVMVLGISCSQGHHNHPDAVYCSQCGTKMGVHHTTVLMNGPRPPLGVLVVDDGTTYSLNADLVIGREPTTHDDVIAGTALPMALTDDTLSLSRRHARIVLDDWSVAVQDLHSSNGTFLSRAGQTESWTQVPGGTSVPLEPGDRLRIGGRIIQVELHHVR